MYLIRLKSVKRTGNTINYFFKPMKGDMYITLIQDRSVDTTTLLKYYAKYIQTKMHVTVKSTTVIPPTNENYLVKKLLDYILLIDDYPDIHNQVRKLESFDGYINAEHDELNRLSFVLQRIDIEELRTLANSLGNVTIHSFMRLRIINRD